MSNDALLNILKWALLALLYLFFARVLWAVWSEVRTPRGAPVTAHGGHSQRNTVGPGVPAIAGPNDPTIGAAPHVPVGTIPLPNGTQPAGKQHGTQRSGAGGVSHTPAPSGPRPAKGKKGQIGRLAVLEPKARRGSAYALAQEITIGRANTCTVATPDDTFVSTLHARIYRQGDTTWLDDLGSTNGTYLNGQRVNAPVQLVVGDRVQVGNTLLEAQ